VELIVNYGSSRGAKFHFRQIYKNRLIDESHSSIYVLSLLTFFSILDGLRIQSQYIECTIRLGPPHLR